jgi:L-fuculose-phosphate aldolase
MRQPKLASESVLKRQMVDLSHRLHSAGLLVGLDGNLSARVEDGGFLCTRAGCHKGMLTQDDLVVVGPDGQWRRGLGQPTSELAVHLACYEERPDVNAIIHSHPPSAIAATLAGLDLDRPLLPEVVLTLGTLPTIPYATTGSVALADAVRPSARWRDALLLERHGVLAMGSDLFAAYCNTETVEQVARVVLDAARLTTVQPLPWDEAVALRRAGLARYGGPPDALAAMDAPDADLRWSTLLSG